MGQFFLIKYVVVYGLSHTFCKIDHVKAPSQPKCVARVHLYSDMWKYFDKGLYKFLVRYDISTVLNKTVVMIEGFEKVKDCTNTFQIYLYTAAEIKL